MISVVVNLVDHADIIILKIPIFDTCIHDIYSYTFSDKGAPKCDISQVALTPIHAIFCLLTRTRTNIHINRTITKTRDYNQEIPQSQTYI